MKNNLKIHFKNQKMYRFCSDSIAFTIRQLAKSSLLKVNKSHSYYECSKRIITPIDYLRNSEFPSVLSMLNLKDGMHVLDIGSPQWFSLYLAYNFPNVLFCYANILESEITPIKQIANVLKINNISYQIDDVRETKLLKNNFDLVISISVIEHIYPENGDILTLNNIKKLLKNETSEVIITLPFREKSKIVYIYGTVYERIISSREKNFFARLYDEKSLNEMLAKSGYKVIEKEYLIERKGLFPLDYCRGEGRDKISKFRRIVANLLSKRFQNRLSKHYLRGSVIPEHRLVGITLKLRSMLQ